VEWGDIRGFRNHIGHACFNEDPDIVWDVLTTHIPALMVVAQGLITVLDQA